MRLHLFLVQVWCPHVAYQDMFTSSPGPRDTIGIKSDPKNFKGYWEDGHPQVRIEVPFVKNTLTGNKKHMNVFSVDFLTHTYESRATSRIAKSRRNLKLKKKRSRGQVAQRHATSTVPLGSPIQQSEAPRKKPTLRNHDKWTNLKNEPNKHMYNITVEHCTYTMCDYMMCICVHAHTILQIYSKALCSHKQTQTQ